MKNIICLLLAIISLFSLVGCNSTLSDEDIYNKAKEVAVEIKTYDKSGAGLALGSGFVYSKDGQVVTNYHVIDEAYSAEVYVGETKYAVSSVLAYDKDIDIAVLKINASNLKTLTISDDEVSTGMTVYALGSSRGLTSTFSKGIASTANREMDGVKYIQHDAAISNGNSGGPLLNGKCEIIGINTLSMKDSQNLNFAISVSELANLNFGTSMTLAQVYEKECDVFTKLKNYIISNGEYDSSDKEYILRFNWVYLDTLKYRTMAYYDTVDCTISLALYLTNADTSDMVFVEMDKIDGSYEWSYVDTYDSFMIGNIYGSLFNSSYLLTYTSYSGISTVTLRNTIRELASTMVHILIQNIDKNYASIGVTAKSLGFVNY